MLAQMVKRESISAANYAEFNDRPNERTTRPVAQCSVVIYREIRFFPVNRSILELHFRIRSR